jgi:hypothetical protein
VVRSANYTSFRECGLGFVLPNCALADAWVRSAKPRKDGSVRNRRLGRQHERAQRRLGQVQGDGCLGESVGADHRHGGAEQSALFKKSGAPPS